MLTVAIPILVSFVTKPTKKQTTKPNNTTKIISTNFITQLTNNSLNIIPPNLKYGLCRYIEELKILAIINTIASYLLVGRADRKLCLILENFVGGVSIIQKGNFCEKAKDTANISKLKNNTTIYQPYHLILEFRISQTLDMPTQLTDLSAVIVSPPTFKRTILHPLISALHLPLLPITLSNSSSFSLLKR